MNSDESLIKNRLTELSRRAENRGIWSYSDFLSLNEQDILLRLKLADCALEGGYEGAERKLAVFGSGESIGWTEPVPIVCVKIAPVNGKFADKLTHRDFLGSLMGLGLRREVLGDIVISENCGYLFCLEQVSGYIIDNLSAVKHTRVSAELSELPDKLTEPPPVTALVVASERLDAVVAAVCRLSRSQSQELIAAGKVFISGRLTQSADAELAEGAIVSVRGTGRFIYEGVERETKRGRLRVRVRVF